MTKELKCPNCGTEFDWHNYDLVDEEFDVNTVHSSYMAYCPTCARRFRFTEYYKFEGYDHIELLGSE